MSTMTRARGGSAARPTTPETCERRMPASPGTRALTLPRRADGHDVDCEEWREEGPGETYVTYRLCYCG